MKTPWNLALIFSTLHLLSGCADKPTAEHDTHLGLWQQIGYGRILELGDSTIKVFDLNSIDCMLSFEEPILDFAEVVGVKGDTLTLKHGIDNWKCIRLKELPVLCSEEKPDANDPAYNLQVFWQNFQEHYCSFDLKGVDWEEVGDHYRSKVTSETTDLELFLLFEEIIELLDDGHIKMNVPDSIEEEYQSVSKDEPPRYNFPDVLNISGSLAGIYVDSLNSVNAGMTRWGMINDRIGYVQINFMLMQADYQLDPQLGLGDFLQQYWEVADSRKDELQRQDEANGMRSTLQRVISELSNAEAFIVDLRFNVGGKDGVAMEIMHHFSSQVGEMAVKYVREKGSFVNHQSIANKPVANSFNGPVYILTSHVTASASELAVLCSLSDPNFIQIGSHTEGIFSSTLDKVLPNGWAYEFSNEIYEDLNGVSYEHAGIPPNIVIEYSEETDEFLDQLSAAIDEEIDPAIDIALQHLSRR